MKITVNKTQLSDSPANLMRRAGYTYIRDRRTGKESYVRRLTGNFYPRLHCYVSEQGPSHKGGASGQVTFNLHLDQRPTRYEGQTAHAGEYDSPVVQTEIERLGNIINNQQTQNNNQSNGNESFDEVVQEKKTQKKSWWPF